jgi:hypothetical protein
MNRLEMGIASSSISVPSTCVSVERRYGTPEQTTNGPAAGKADTYLDFGEPAHGSALEYPDHAIVMADGSVREQAEGQCRGRYAGRCIFWITR